MPEFQSQDLRVIASRAETRTIFPLPGGKVVAQAGDYVVEGPGGRKIPVDAQLFETMFSEVTEFPTAESVPAYVDPVAGQTQDPPVINPEPDEPDEDEATNTPEEIDARADAALGVSEADADK